MPFLVVLFVFLGCAPDQAVKTDPFFDKWQTTAHESLGHSPTPRDRIVILPETKVEEGEGQTATSQTKMAQQGAEQMKPLSTEKVTLRMRQADVKAVIRALARATGKNIIVRNDIKGEINVDFTSVPFDQAFTNILRTQGLSYLVDGDIIRVVTLDDMEQSLKLSAFQEKRKAQEMDVKRVEPLVTMVVNVDYADPELLRENLQEFLTKDKDGKLSRGSVKVDKQSNALLVHAIRDDVNRMIPIIEKIDKALPQINIKAHIVETSKQTARDLGIQWGGVYRGEMGNHDLFITPGGIGGTAGVSPLNGDYTPTSVSRGIGGQGWASNFPGAGLGLGGSGSLGLIFGTIGGSLLEVQLNALQKDNKLNILSSPSITTLDNQKAFTENGERIPYVTEVTNAGGGTTQEVKFEDAVLRLEITPHVIDGKNLKMKILVKKDEVDPIRNVQGNPYIIKKQTETSLIVEDGETIVISGLSKQRISGGNHGVPGLKDIPALGWLFKEDAKSETMEEVLIFITPRILPPREATALNKDTAPDTAGKR